jgi:hypothetical protein
MMISNRITNESPKFYKNQNSLHYENLDSELKDDTRYSNVLRTLTFIFLITY